MAAVDLEWRVDNSYTAYIGIAISLVTLGYVAFGTRRSVQREAIDDVRKELTRCKEELKDALDKVRRLNDEVDRLTRIVMSNYRSSDKWNKDDR